MSRFLSRLDVELVDEGAGTWRLKAPLTYVSERYGIMSVPAGFVTDFASVPRLPVVYWLTGDTAHEAAAVHDWLYATGFLPRADADAVLLEAMGATGVPAWRRYAMWAAVRVFGGRRYSSPATEVPG